MKPFALLLLAWAPLAAGCAPPGPRVFHQPAGRLVLAYEDPKECTCSPTPANQVPKPRCDCSKIADGAVSVGCFPIQSSHDGSAPEIERMLRFNRYSVTNVVACVLR